MSEIKHTPGLWTVAEESFDNDGIQESVIRGLDGRAAIAVALDFGENNPGMREANAQPIAAAPDLLETLQALVDNGGIGPESMFHNARAAIAKATGGVGMSKKGIPYHAGAHRDLLISTLSAYDNSDLPDGAWQAMLEDGAKAFSEAHGIHIEPFDAFMEYVEHGSRA